MKKEKWNREWGKNSIQSRLAIVSRSAGKESYGSGERCCSGLLEWLRVFSHSNLHCLK